jgi:DNA-binding response OmpR family regulator
MLPGKDGVSVCKELRQNSVHTPIIMLTAKSQLNDTVVGLDSGADDYLTKPFSFEELLARLRAITRRPRKANSNMLKVGGLCLDRKTFDVERDGKKISLSNKEFSLLEYMLRNPNRILSKNQIITHVWDYDADILPNTVEVYIRNLRKKIDFPFPKNSPLIHTIRGFGYKVAEPEK